MSKKHHKSPKHYKTNEQQCGTRLSKLCMWERCCFHIVVISLTPIKSLLAERIKQHIPNKCEHVRRTIIRNPSTDANASVAKLLFLETREGKVFPCLQQMQPKRCRLKMHLNLPYHKNKKMPNGFVNWCFITGSLRRVLEQLIISKLWLSSGEQVMKTGIP